MDMKKQDIGYFLSFCIEQYKNAKGMDGAEVIDTFAKYDVFDYLNTHFEILHTQSRQWILEDIDEYINLRKGDGEWISLKQRRLYHDEPYYYSR